MHLKRWLPAFVLVTLATISTKAQDSAVKTVEFEAPSVGRTMKYNVSLPDGYETSGKKYPVVYLLHGLTSNYTAWKDGRGEGPRRRTT